MVPLCPRAWGTLNHLRKSPYFEKPVPRMGDRQGISMIKPTTEMIQEGCREEQAPHSGLEGAVSGNPSEKRG